MCIRAGRFCAIFTIDSTVNRCVWVGGGTVNMMINIRSKQRGLNLIEMMLVLAVMVMIVIGGLRQYQSYRVQNNISIIASDVDILLRSLQQYWFATCANNNTITSTTSFATNTAGFYYYQSASDTAFLDDLLAAGSIPKGAYDRIKKLGNPYGSTLFNGRYGNQAGITYISPNPTSSTLSVPFILLYATFENATPAILQQIVNQTGGELLTSPPKSIYWVRIIQQNPDSKELWLLRSDLERFRIFEQMGTPSAPNCVLGK